MPKSADHMTQRLIIGVTGASGATYAQSLLQQIAQMDVESHLVVTAAARMTMAYELGADVELGPADYQYGIKDVGAPIASGSFRTAGMIIAPCSIKTMSEIATGITSTLITRAADVCLKERRPLVLMVRETPFHLGHLRTMATLTEMGAIVAPPLPAFYAEPQTVQDMVDQSVAKALDLVGLKSPLMKRWGEDLEKGKR